MFSSDPTVSWLGPVRTSQTLMTPLKLKHNGWSGPRSNQGDAAAVATPGPAQSRPTTRLAAAATCRPRCIAPTVTTPDVRRPGVPYEFVKCRWLGTVAHLRFSVTPASSKTSRTASKNVPRGRFTFCRYRRD